MRFIHTADWHLGKSLKNQPLLDDQIYILNEFMKLVDDTKIDAIIIAGDVYDRSIPPSDAVSIFDEFIVKAVERKIPVLCISGNHDGAVRMKFGSELFKQSNFFITTQPVKNPAPVILSDNFGDVYFSLIPYFETSEIKEIFALDNLNINNAVKIYIDAARKNIPAGKRSVAIGHLFVMNGITSESERKFVGAVESIDVANFADYNYTALGHLHKPQTMKKTGHIVRYSGSLLKYSFDESNYDKGVTIVDIDGTGKTTFEHINLKPRRDVRIVEGTIAELENLPRTEDYIHANITNKNHILYAMDKLRQSVFPNILSVQFVNLERETTNRSVELREGVPVLEHFSDFFKYQTGENLDGDYRIAMEKLLTQLERDVES